METNNNAFDMEIATGVSAKFNFINHGFRGIYKL